MGKSVGTIDVAQDRGRPVVRQDPSAEALRRIDDNVQRLVDTDRDHEQRLRALESRPDPTTKLAEIATTLRSIERWRWLVSGAYVAGGGGMGAVVTLLLGNGGPW